MRATLFGMIVVAGLLGGLLLGGCTPAEVTKPTPTPTADEIPGMVAAHNQVRSGVSPAASPAIPGLVWSSTLAATAKAWVEQCKWGHSGQSGVGENIYAGTGNYEAAQVVQSWASEVEHYQYSANTCASGKVCGHYTQIVWRDTTQVGCAKARCKGLLGGREAEYWACQYSPPGNYRGKKPY